MEPRNAIGDWDGKRSTLYASCQARTICATPWPTRFCTSIPRPCGAVTPDVGGGFGTKIFIYPEHPLVVWAAKKLGRPVKWTGERPDSFLADAHGRDNVIDDRRSRWYAVRRIFPGAADRQHRQSGRLPVRSSGRSSRTFAAPT